MKKQIFETETKTKNSKARKEEKENTSICCIIW